MSVTAAPPSSCASCGAGVTGAVCSYCGALVTPVERIEEEMGALDELHACIRKADKNGQLRLLRGGFLPTHEEVIVEAGLRCMPMISSTDISGEPTHSAALRLKTIVAKLRIAVETTAGRNALQQFETELASYTRTNRKDLIAGLIIIAMALCLGAWCVAWLVR